MYDKKRIALLFSASTLLAACGGGGGDTVSSAAGTQPVVSGTPAAGSTATSPSTAGTSAPSPSTGNTSSGSTSNTGTPATGTSTTAPSTTAPSTTTSPSAGSTSSPPATDPTPVTTTTIDQQLKGHLEIVANQVLYIRMNRVIYLPVTLDEFESDRGIVDVAPGSTLPPPLNIDAAAAGCNPEIDGTCGVQPPAAAPAAPIAAFGVRIDKHVLPTSPGQNVANQTVVGRIAVDLTERSGTPGVGSNEVPEIMRFVIDKVEMKTDATGELVSVKVQDGAQIHVYGRNAAGVEVRQDIPAPVGTVRPLPMSAVPDSHGDDTSFFLLLDLETGFSQAGQKLTALENIAGQFSMRVILSSAPIVRPGETAPASQQDVVGQQITVSGQQAVTGKGLVGNAWIRMYPPN